MANPAERAVSDSKVSEEASSVVRDAQALYRAAKNSQLIELIGNGLPPLDKAASVRLRILKGMASFDLGDAVQSISDLTAAVEESRGLAPSAQFTATFALFLRESDFLGPEEIIPRLTQLRQLASLVGDAGSIALRGAFQPEFRDCAASL